jgi:cell division protein FtsL
MEVETTKKSQRETTLEIEILGKKSGAIDANITNRIQKMEEKISCAKDNIENMNTTIKENAAFQRIIKEKLQNKEGNYALEKARK